MFAAVAAAIVYMPQTSPALLPDLPVPIVEPLLDPSLDPLLDPLFGQERTPPPHDLAADERYFVQRINEARRARGLRTLAVRSDLTESARRQALRMAAKLDIWHNPALGDDVPGWLTVGENVGWSRTTIVELHQSFMDSPEHRENILWRTFNEIGIGEAIGSDGRIFVAELFAERRTRATKARAVPEPQRPQPALPQPLPPQTLTQLLRIIGLDG